MDCKKYILIWIVHICIFSLKIEKSTFLLWNGPFLKQFAALQLLTKREDNNFLQAKPHNMNVASIGILVLNKGTGGFTSNTLLIPKQDQLMVQSLYPVNTTSLSAI